ncbi:MULTISPECIES: helix-turn-helix domain-containing protein [unclassified Staphylococcus]|uniref:helix-turn-helix domain-containing protein n=1 Tax=unclassified Staphylococcus TaxID=91994 RepID=UPI001AEBFE96|nr:MULTISPECIES: helix-turn-helix domain-containing protein [unclassified Staphylococcus]
MYNLIRFTRMQAHNYKTEKSIYNIITGKKSHQTFFDACSQQLLSLYHSLPNLKYPSFVGYIQNGQQDVDGTRLIRTHPRYTYDSLLNTFKALQLLTQTISNISHDSLHFVPITHNNTIQHRVKKVYNSAKNKNISCKLNKELNLLFSSISEKNSKTYLHYYLQGYKESMYTRQQVSLIENISQQQLFELEINELVIMMFELENAIKYPILNQLIILPTLLFKTEETYIGIKKGLSFNELAKTQNVKSNTIEDHILELFIKGYLSQYDVFINDNSYSQFLSYYVENRSERLRNYKEKFPKLNYFEIKLLIIGVERGDLNVTS